VTVREMIKILKKYRKINPGVIFISERQLEQYEVEPSVDKNKSTGEWFDYVKLACDEYTNTDGTRGWWLHFWIKKIKEEATR